MELLLVIAILGLLASLLLPAVQAAREATRRAACASNLQQSAVASRGYETARGTLPPGRVGCDDTGETIPITGCPPGLPPEKKTAASGFVEILPYLELQTLYAELGVASGGLWNRNVDNLGWYYDPEKHKAVQQTVALFRCPSDASERLSSVYAPVIAATGSYVLVQGAVGPGAPNYEKSVAKYANDGIFLYVHRRNAREVVDGLSSTAMLGEVVLADAWESSNTWTYARLNADSLRTTANPLNTLPGDGATIDRQNGALGSLHPTGANFAFADGHVAFIQNGIDLIIYRAMSTIAGAETVGAP